MKILQQVKNYCGKEEEQFLIFFNNILDISLNSSPNYI